MDYMLTWDLLDRLVRCLDAPFESPVHTQTSSCKHQADIRKHIWPLLVYNELVGPAFRNHKEKLLLCSLQGTIEAVN
jgi:hypothetical protein